MGDEELGSLVERARRGDRAAQDEIVRRYEARVRAAIHGRIGHDLRARVDTADVLQSTMAASLADLAGMEFRGEAAFVGWLTRVAERRISATRKRHRALARDAGREVPLGADPGPAEPLTSPPHAVERDESEAYVRATVARLPDLERRVVELRSYEGLGFLEIAQRLGLPDRHVARNAFLRALKRMGELLGERGARPQG